MRLRTMFLSVVAMGVASSAAAQGILTETFGNAEHCVYANTLSIKNDTFRFDVSAIAASTVVLRAVFDPEDLGGALHSTA